jgi:hypothetical protein
MSKPVPGAETIRDAIIQALAVGPMTKAELARRLALHATTLGGHLATLESRGRILIRAGQVGLPGQLDEGEPMTAEEKLHEQFKMLWQRRGYLTVCPADIQDGFIRERLSLIGNALYGRRGSPR